MGERSVKRIGQPRTSGNEVPFAQRAQDMPIKRSLAAKISIEVLRNKYPSPKPAWNSGRTLADYCVGGALCRELCAELGYPESKPPLFPNDELLAKALCLCNNNLPKREALTLARKINLRNEKESYEDAWAALEEGLEYG